MGDKFEITFDQFHELSRNAQNEILRVAFSRHADVRSMPNQPESEVGLAKLSVTEARQFVSGLMYKTKDFLRLLVDAGGREKSSVLVEKMGMERWQDLKGIRAGITRRMETVTGSDKASLVCWDENANEYDDNGEWIDGVLMMSSETVSSLKKVL